MPRTQAFLSEAAVALRAWREAQALSRPKFAIRINVTGMTVYTWECGANMPDLLRALAVDEATGGAVSVYGWAKPTPVATRITRERIDADIVDALDNAAPGDLPPALQALVAARRGEAPTPR